MRILTNILRVLLALILLLPVAGALGFFPEPTADLYTPEGWAFMSALMETSYILPLFSLMCLICAVLLFTGHTALSAVILTPLSVNVIAFHLFLDATPINAAGIPAYLLVLLNLYFLWISRSKYSALLSR